MNETLTTPRPSGRVRYYFSAVPRDFIRPSLSDVRWALRKLHGVGVVSIHTKTDHGVMPIPYVAQKGKGLRGIHCATVHENATVIALTDPQEQGPRATRSTHHYIPFTRRQAAQFERRFQIAPHDEQRVRVHSVLNTRDNSTLGVLSMDGNAIGWHVATLPANQPLRYARAPNPARS